MSENTMEQAGASAEPTAEQQAEAVADPKKVKKAKAEKVKAEKKERQPRTDTVWHTLQALFAQNASFETICKKMKEKHPDSKFNGNEVLHYNYYRAKYNMAAKKNSTEPTTSKGPVREAKPKAEKKSKKAEPVAA